jgi:predicted nucleic acid-binding protein
MYVIDASVHVADMSLQEPHHAEAQALMSRVVAEGWTVYLPMIVLPEIASAISRGTGRPALGQRLVTTLKRVPYFELIPVDEALGQLAAELAAEYRIRGCDAVYVPLAQQREATLITLDRQQRERVPPDITARTPAEELAEKGGTPESACSGFGGLA